MRVGVLLDGLVAAVVLTAGAAQAQPASDALRSESSLDTTGKLIAPTSVTDLRAAMQPPPAPVIPGNNDEEHPVATPAPAQRQQPRLASVMALDSNMGKRVTDLLACRLEIAGDRRVKVDQVVAGALLMRGTVRPDGAVDNAEVVALRDTDPDVLSCVKRKIGGWLILRPARSTPVDFQQELQFP